MRNGVKAALWAAAIGGGCYLLYRTYKREVKKIEKEEKRAKADLISVGVNKEEIEDNLEPGEDDTNLSKALHAAVRLSDDGELNETIEIENALNETHVVRIVQDSSGASGDWLKLMFQVPTGKTYCSNSPEIGDYITAIKGEMNYIKDNILVNSPNAFMRLEGYYVLLHVSDEGPDDKKYFGVRHIQIPREDYEGYATKGRDGLSDYVADLMNNDMAKLHKLSIERGVPYSEAVLLFTIGFPIGFTRRDGIGFGLGTAFEALKHIKDDFVVTKGRLGYDLAIKSGVRYENFLFHPFGNLDRYYDYNVEEKRTLDYAILIEEDEYPDAIK